MSEEYAPIVIPMRVADNNVTVPLRSGETIQPEVNRDYERLDNKPSINGVELIGDRTFEDLGEETITNAELLALINQQYDIVFGGG